MCGEVYTGKFIIVNVVSSNETERARWIEFNRFRRLANRYGQ